MKCITDNKQFFSNDEQDDGDWQWDLTSQNSNFEDAYARGLQSYHLGELDAAINHFQTAANLNVDHNRVKELLATADAIRNENEAGN